jgi:hypothetical protein
MVNPGDGEHSEQIQSHGERNRRPAPADDKNAQTAQMENYERKAAEPVDAVDISDARRHTSSMIIRIKPLNNKSDKEVRTFWFH